MANPTLDIKQKRRKATTNLFSNLLAGGGVGGGTPSLVTNNNGCTSAAPAQVQQTESKPASQAKKNSVAPAQGQQTESKAAAQAKKKQSTAQPRPQIHVKPGEGGPVQDPNVNDVLAGRGGRINAHSGNVQFREIVAARKKLYLDKETKKLEKAHIAADIVYHIRNLTPPGRFLKEDGNGVWFDIGDQKAIKKVGQALREDATEVRGDDDNDGDDDDYPINTTSGDRARSKSPQSRSKTPPVICRKQPVVPDSVDSSSTTSANRIPSPLPVATKHRMISAPVIVPLKPTKADMMGHQPIPPTPKQQQQPMFHPQQSPQLAEYGAAHQGYGGMIFHPPTNFGPSSAGGVHAGQYPPHVNVVTGFRAGGMTPKKPVISGAAKAVMSTDDLMAHGGGPHNPQMTNGTEHLFGREFHPPVERDSSMISGMSGMSGISALTDPMSSLSCSGSGGDFPGSGMTFQQYTQNREERLDHLRQKWEQSMTVSSTKQQEHQLRQQHQPVGASSSTPLSNNVGNSLTSSAIEEAIREAHAMGGSSNNLRVSSLSMPQGTDSFTSNAAGIDMSWTNGPSRMMMPKAGIPENSSFGYDNTNRGPPAVSRNMFHHHPPQQQQQQQYYNYNQQQQQQQPPQNFSSGDSIGEASYQSFGALLKDDATFSSNMSFTDSTAPVPSGAVGNSLTSSGVSMLYRGYGGDDNDDEGGVSGSGMMPPPLPPQYQQQQYQQHFSGNQSVATMSINSGDFISLQSVSESVSMPDNLSQTFDALELADHGQPAIPTNIMRTHRTHHHQSNNMSSGPVVDNRNIDPSYQGREYRNQVDPDSDNISSAGSVMYDGRPMLEI